MLPQFEKNSQYSQEPSHLLQAKSEELLRSFQMFMEQQQRTPMGKLAEVKYKNIHSMLRTQNQRKQQQLKLKHEQVQNTRKAAVDTICQKTTDGFKFIRVDAEEDSRMSIRPMTSQEPSMLSTRSCKQLQLSERFTQLKKKLKEVEQTIFKENMVHDGLKTTLEVEKQVNALMRNKVNSFHHKNEILEMKNSWYIHVKNMAGCEKISSKAFVEKTQKMMVTSSKKDLQRIDKWAEKSRSLHRQQQQLKSDYLKQACRLDQLHALNNERVAEVKKLVARQPIHSGKRDTLAQIIADIDLVIRNIHQNEENFEAIVLESCGKPRTRLRVAQSMDTMRISQIELINCFEAKYNFKVEAAEKIIIWVYIRLRQNQKKIVIEFDEWTTIKQEKEQELKLLQEKLASTMGQLTSNDHDREPTLEDIHKAENDCQSLVEQTNARNKFLLDVTQYLIGMVSRIQLYLDKLQGCTELGRFQEVAGVMARLSGKYDPLADKKQSLQKYMAKEKLVWEFVRDSFPTVRDLVQRECCSLLTGNNRFMYSIKPADLRLCLNSHQDESGVDAIGIRESDNGNFHGIFGFLSRALTKSHETHLQYIWDMLKAITSCHQQLRSKELPRICKLPTPKGAPTPSKSTTNPNKFYSVFVSNDDPDPIDDKISNKFIINETERVEQQQNARQNCQNAIISKFLKVATQPIANFHEAILAVGGKSRKEMVKTKKKLQVHSRNLKSAGGF